MEYTGLINKFKINRPLRDEERELRLHQRQRLDIKPEHELSVIRVNSTFLEISDVYFAWKGLVALGTVTATTFMLAMFGEMFFYSLVTPGRMDNDWPYLIGLGLLIGIAAVAFLWLAHFECFRHTHYPMRFNRKTRKVHVFRTNGTVLTADWDKLFFCLGRSYQARQWTIQGHVLADDGKTVLETFSFPQPAFGHRERDQLRHVWEYVRRYMEEGPKPLIDQTPVVLPIANHRESFLFGWHRVHAINTLIALPVYLFIYPGRWLAMHTSKIPQWPAEIEQQCQVLPDDPYVRDVNTNPAWAR